MFFEPLLATEPLSSNDKGLHTWTHKECGLTAEELLDAVFSLWYDPKLYIEDSLLLGVVLSSQL